MKIFFSALALSVVVVSSGCVATTSTNDESTNDESTNGGQPIADPPEETGQTSQAYTAVGPCGVFVDHSGSWDTTWIHNCNGHALLIYVDRNWQLDTTFCVASGQTKFMSDTWRLQSWTIKQVYSGSYCPA